MGRPRVATAVAVAVTLLLAACSSSGQPAVERPAATVNGTDISTEVLDEMVDFISNLDGLDEMGAPSDEPDGLTVSTALVAQVLTELIVVEIVTGELAEQGIEVTDEDRDAAREAVYVRFGTDPNSGMVDPAQGQAVYEQRPEVIQTLAVDFEVARAALASEVDVPEITDEEIEQAYELRRETMFERRCLEAVFFDSSPLDAMARATDVREALDEGIELTEAVDADPEDLTGPQVIDECVTRTDVGDPELIDVVFGTEVGSIVGPVESGPVLLVAVIYDEQVDELADVSELLRPELEQAAAAEAAAGSDDAFFGLLQELMAEADVWVDPRHGSWALVDATGQPVDPDDADGPAGFGATFMVLPPEGPQVPPAGDPAGGFPGEIPIDGFPGELPIEGFGPDEFPAGP